MDYDLKFRHLDGKTVTNYITMNKKLNRDNYEIILIVGNGFDLNLDLETSYRHFIESKNFKDLENSNNDLAKYLSKTISLRNWIDVENELKRYSKKTTNSSERLYKEFIDLSETLKNYLKSIKYDWLDENKDAYKVISDNRDKSILIIDFNYTSTISKILYDLNMGIDKNNGNIEHIKIHGSIKSNDIIFGVEDKADIKQEHIFLKKSVNENFNPIDFRGAMEKCGYFIVFGHSLGETDHMYFDDFFYEASNHNKPSQNIQFYYYGEESYYDLHAQLDSLTNRNIKQLKQKNRVVFLNLKRPDRLLRG